MSARDVRDVLTMFRQAMADAARRVDMEPFIRACEELGHRVEIKAFSIAQRIDPRPADPWMTVGTDDGDYERFAEEIMRPMQEAVGRMMDRATAADYYGVPFQVPTPFVHEAAEHILRPEILEQVRQASERGEVLTPQQMAALKVDKFAPFDQTDMAPFVDMVNDHVREVSLAYAKARDEALRDILVKERGLDETALDQWVGLTDEQREAQRAPWRVLLKGSPPWRAFGCPIRDCVGRYSEEEWERYVSHWQTFHGDVFTL